MNEITDSNRDTAGRFVKGCKIPGTGKPPGTKAGLIRAELYEHADELLKASIAAALDGDASERQFLIGRILPPLKPQSLPLNLDMSGVNNLIDLGNRLIGACCDGSTGSPDTAIATLAALGHLARVEEATELRARIEELERKLTQ